MEAYVYNPFGGIVLTSNDLRVRPDKMKMGRIAIILKEHAGYTEGSNMFVALKNLAELNEALKDDHKVLKIDVVLVMMFYFLASGLFDSNLLIVVPDGKSSR